MLVELLEKEFITGFNKELIGVDGVTGSQILMLINIRIAKSEWAKSKIQ